MYLRWNRRFKDGKEHRYWSIVESRRCAGGKIVQRQVLYLGEINDSQRVAWCHLIEAFDEQSQRHTQLALFPADQTIPTQAQAHGVQVCGRCVLVQSVSRTWWRLEPLAETRANDPSSKLETALRGTPESFSDTSKSTDADGAQ
jgi:hypothetical protein